MMNKEDMSNSSNNGAKILGAIVAAIIILGGIGYAVNNQNVAQKTKDEAAMSMKKTEDAAMMKKQEAEAMMKKEGDAMMKNADGTMKKTEDSAMMKKTEDTAMMAKAGVFKNYDVLDLAKAKDGSHVVLFFNASWCPTCQATVKDINSKLDKIDPKVNILSVDYDSNVALRQKYGVTMQHTFVDVNADGSLIKKIGGLATVETINDFALK